MNPNDKSADIYDLYTTPLKGPAVTAAEMALITELLPSASKVLDIGGGTGRHAIPLAQGGHHVTILDSSLAMLHQVQSKIQKLGLNNQVEILNENALHHPISTNTYNLIVMMWNTFNEVVLTETDALILLRKCRDALVQDGRILINIDNAETFDPTKLKFATTYETDTLVYIQNWEVIDFDAATNTTLSRETIIVQNPQGETVREERSDIRQRWWHAAEIESMARNMGLTVERKNIQVNAELYLLLHR